MDLSWADDFEKLYKQRGQQKYGLRLLALWKIQSGETATNVCSMLGKTHKTIGEWRKRYESEGLDGLLSIRPGRGLKSRLLDAEAFERDLNKLGDAKRGGRIRAQDVIDMVYEKYGVSYSQSGMYHLLKRFGFSWITSRSKHPKHNQAEIEAFKKTL